MIIYLQLKKVVLRKTTLFGLIKKNNRKQLKLMKGVITADIVNSSKISAEERHTLLDTLKKVESDFNRVWCNTVTEKNINAFGDKH